jgi:GntR family phosphonate transport system transcriptional regulator
MRLEEEIRGGALSPGAQLPTEGELAARFGVHRHTIRRALERLREKRVIRVEQGSGTFVQEPVVLHRVSNRMQLSRVVTRLGRSVSRRVLEDTELVPPREIQAALGLGSAQRAVKVETIRLVDDRAIAVTSHFFPMPRFRGIGALIAAHGSVSVALEAYGVTELTHRHSRVAARKALRRDAGFLSQPASAPVLHVTNLAVDQSRLPVQYTVTRFASHWVEYVIDHDP